MNHSYKIILIFTIFLQSCWGDKGAPNYEYMPNMYESLSYEAYSENQIFEDEFRNSNNIIRVKLLEIQKTCKNFGYKNIRIICEPSGGYQDKLMRTARNLKMFTCYVNPESVSKFRMVESNDTGKTDTFTTTKDLSKLKEMSGAPLGGDFKYPDGPDILCINIFVTAGTVEGTVQLSWAEAQA